MKRVVSISLGSSQRNARAELKLLGEDVALERIGTDGDKRRFAALIREHDGRADAIGLGGIDLFLQAGQRRHYLRDAVRLARHATRTPVVDGNGIKNAWEPHIVRDVLPVHLGRRLRDLRVLLVSAVDRYGMAKAFADGGARVVYGDLLYGLGLPVPLRSLRTVHLLAAILLPALSLAPIEWLYPTGSRQEVTTPKFARFFLDAEVIAGDFHLIRRYMPDELAGRVVLTQTVTPTDLEQLRRRRVKSLITTGPVLNGRSFGTNVLEGLVVAFAGPGPHDAATLTAWMTRFGFQPRVERLDATAPDSPRPAAGMT
ncbi:MAG: quinate 5-dehydrogenase [Armatimonadetes bacterium]|nr:quinate 5-dehydrogenase [Armatimonadota bacterium]